MRQYRIITPTSSITNFTSKLLTDNKKDKNSTSTNSNADTIKKKSNIISANASPTIRKMRKIRSRTTNNSISPEQAAVVVKDYIMPLFRLEKESKHIRRRTEFYNTKAKPAEFKEIGMISDFKLVENLHTKVENLKKLQDETQDSLKKANQEKELYENDYKVLNDQLLNTESNITFLNYIHTQNIKKSHQEAFSSWMIKEQCSKFKSLYEEELVTSESLSKLLEEEKAKSDKIKNMAIKLEYVNSLLVMENDLLGEKLKGLIMSLEHIIGTFNINFKFQEEFLKISQVLKVLAQSSQKDLQVFQAVKEEKDELELLVKELSDITLGIQDRKDKYIKVLKDKNSRMDFELKQVTITRDRLKTDFEDLSKKFADLQDEHLKLRTRIKKFKKAFSDDMWEEKYCKNCSKAFSESENFNWSCKRHASNYNEDRYWCCGQTDKDAEGCITSLHAANDEVMDEQGTQDVFAVFCSVNDK